MRKDLEDLLNKVLPETFRAELIEAIEQAISEANTEGFQEGYDVGYEDGTAE